MTPKKEQTTEDVTIIEDTEDQPNHPLSQEEQTLTKRNLQNAQYEYNKTLHHQSKLIWQLNELPYIHQQYTQALEQNKRECETLKQAIKNAEQLLQRGTQPHA